jgi:hypothetical protein
MRTRAFEVDRAVACCPSPRPSPSVLRRSLLPPPPARASHWQAAPTRSLRPPGVSVTRGPAWTGPPPGGAWAIHRQSQGRPAGRQQAESLGLGFCCNRPARRSASLPAGHCGGLPVAERASGWRAELARGPSVGGRWLAAGWDSPQLAPLSPARPARPRGRRRRSLGGAAGPEPLPFTQWQAGPVGPGRAVELARGRQPLAGMDACLHGRLHPRRFQAEDNNNASHGGPIARAWRHGRRRRRFGSEVGDRSRQGSLVSYLR